MNMLRIGDYSAWVSVEGKGREVYGVERTSDNSLTCWIASEVGKKFAVNWYNTRREIALQGTVIIDGMVCDNHIMLDAPHYPDKPNGVGVSYTRTSDYTRRDFMFSKINITDDDAYLDTIDLAMNIGTITLELWRLHVTSVKTQVLEHKYGGPVLEGQIVHERSKKAGAHHVKFGKEYASAPPTMDLVQGYNMDQLPYLTFTFKYRPMEILMANGIVPRSAMHLVPLQNLQTAREIRQLEERLRQLRSGGNKPNSSPRIKVEPGRHHRDLPQVIDLTHLD
ncbi:hypothetical protein BDQ12DRAFT_248760 [Crucibulum laeve]|uniref:DUF7918 domain-containing protein n=1 Tax=Crucibulum laeve TaxID=68775 RepID=A0A5C3LTA2_9AGAR|nr:hypothetical protein BDQ12DRAFT_248760 [Crucibulum laeve]